MSKSLAVVLCAAATLALSGCPFDKTPEPKAQQPIGAATTAPSWLIAGPVAPVPTALPATPV